MTGLGVLSAVSQDTPSYWESLRKGRCGIRAFVSPDHPKIQTAARLQNYRAEDHFSKTQIRNLDAFAQYFVLAGRQAIADSGQEFCKERTAVLSATASGGTETLNREFQRIYLEKKSNVAPLTIPKVMPNAGASQLCLEYGLTGPAMTLSTACSSSNHAIGMAYWMVRHGMAEAAVTGGSEAPFSHGNLKAWEATRIVDSSPCRPFSACRKGISLGEGAACLVLEALDSALQRGAKIYGEILGFGMTADAHHLMKPHVQGASAAMSAALKDAALSPTDIDYINAHGTATALNDVTESQAIRDVFGEHGRQLLVSSTKSMHGHALGAAGALEAAATILALQHGMVPPTINCRTPDPDCDLNVVVNQSREAPLKHALSNSFAFGGLNAVLAFGKV